jgi:membrane-associated protein
MLAAILAAAPWKPEFWFEKAGSAAIWIVAAVIFAESGMMVGFFFPGDSMLFFTGFLTSDAARNPSPPISATEQQFADFASHLPPLYVIFLLLFVAAVLGDQLGYLIGRKAGPSLFARPNSKIFRQDYLAKAHAFFEKNGSKSIVLARFVPIVRTFTPVVAGAAEMRYRTYLTFDLIGGFLWAVGLTALGHFLGQIEFFRDNIEYAILGVILISLTPVIIELVRNFLHKRKAAELAESESETEVSA